MVGKLDLGSRLKEHAKDGIKEGDEGTHEEHGYEHHDRGVIEFLILGKALFFGIPRPSGFSHFEGNLTKIFANATHEVFEDFVLLRTGVAGQEGLEPTTNGFGDRYSTN
jgi:hypothetical protein